MTDYITPNSNSEQIEAALCSRVEKIRLSRNLTQKQLADEAGVSLRTIGRLEKGEGVSLETFIRVLIALRIQHNLTGLLPDPAVRPVERVRARGHERLRARPTTAETESAAWTWAEHDGNDD
jgi:transcriptional regulator with XRE-family HTH domain